jgi:hypothetical protein
METLKKNWLSVLVFGLILYIGFLHVRSCQKNKVIDNVKVENIDKKSEALEVENLYLKKERDQILKANDSLISVNLQKDKIIEHYEKQFSSNQKKDNEKYKIIDGFTDAELDSASANSTIGPPKFIVRIKR